MGYIEQYLEAGIKIYTSQGTIDNFEFKGIKRPTPCESEKRFKIGSFTIMPFDTIHDAPQPFGFVIRHKECGTVVFLTDSYYSKYRFENVNHFMVESNFCPDILEKRIDSGSIPKAAVKRLTNSHMSIKTCKKFLLANDLSQVKNIVLIHLSDGNSDAKQFRKEIIQATGKQVFIADRGVEVDFNLNSF